MSVIEALEQAGFDPSPASIRKMIIPKDKVGAGAGHTQMRGQVVRGGWKRTGVEALGVQAPGWCWWRSAS